ANPGRFNASVLHVPTIKPFDTEGVAEFAAGVDRLVTAQNHVLHGGLTTLVTDTLYRASVVRPLRSVGIPDRFIECGSLPYLQTRYGLTAESVAETTRHWLGDAA
ncbi:transketolase C-terminal domain-containing protein, partial [Haematobacter genomosp. 1]|uniref:transketolase C-terminal domain-containing protein n=1 Tax=Haematobacter genomosp. 1 TaxID=366618 RepID=UPI002795506F